MASGAAHASESGASTARSMSMPPTSSTATSTSLSNSVSTHHHPVQVAAITPPIVSPVMSTQGPPAAAFASLPLEKKFRQRRAVAKKHVPSKVVDPLEGLNYGNNTTGLAQLETTFATITTTEKENRRTDPATAAAAAAATAATATATATANGNGNGNGAASIVSLPGEDDGHNNNHVPNNNQALFDNLNRNWRAQCEAKAVAENKVYSPEVMQREQACLAAFCCLFQELPDPPVAVVDGLWSYVVLPQLLVESETLDYAQDPSLVTKEIWDVLGRKLQYISKNNDTGVVLVVHSVYVEYGHFLAKDFPIRTWKHRFGEWLERTLLCSPLPSTLRLKSPSSLDTKFTYSNSTLSKNALLQTRNQAPDHRPDNNDNDNNNANDQLEIIHSYAARNLLRHWLDGKCLPEAGSLLEDSVFLQKLWKYGGNVNALQITLQHVANMKQYLEELPGDTTASRQSILSVFSAWHNLLEQEADGLQLAVPFYSRTSYDMFSSSGDEGSSHGDADSSGTPTTENSFKCHKKKLFRRHKRRQRKLLEKPTQVLMLGRTLFCLGNSMTPYLLQLPGTTQDPTVNALWEKQAQYLSQSLELLVHLLLKDNLMGGNSTSSVHRSSSGGDRNYNRHKAQSTSFGNTAEDTDDEEEENSLLHGLILFRVCALLCAESWMCLGMCLKALNVNNDASPSKVDVEHLASIFAPVFAKHMEQHQEKHGGNSSDSDGELEEDDDHEDSSTAAVSLSHAISSFKTRKGNNVVHCLKIARQLLKLGDNHSHGHRHGENGKSVSAQTVLKRNDVASSSIAKTACIMAVSANPDSITKKRIIRSKHPSKHMDCTISGSDTNNTDNNSMHQGDFADSTKTLCLLKERLYAQINDTMGHLLFGIEKYADARGILEEATNHKRTVLSILRGDLEDYFMDDENSNTEDHLSAPMPEGRAIVSAEQPSFFSSWRTSFTSSHGGARNSIPRNLRRNITESLGVQLCLVQPQSNMDAQIVDMEISLAQTLEKTGMAIHYDTPHVSALSWLQEALILKTMHLGKMNLDVAWLHAYMGQVHDDLGQWDTSVSRYRECLRIRMHFYGRSHNGRLFAGILCTLRDMGNAYRMLGDYDNALGCYWKVANMARNEWERMRKNVSRQTYFCGFGIDSHKTDLCPEFRGLPLPHLVLNECLRPSHTKKNNRNSRSNSSSDTSVDESESGGTVESISGATNKAFPPPHSQRMQRQEEKVNPDENDILREAAQAHQTVINIFKDKASNSKKNKTNQQKALSALQNPDPMSLASMTADEDIPLLLSASYQLGVIHMFFGEYGSAIARLEHSLRCLWILDPYSSSSSSDGSQSDGSTRSNTSTSIVSSFSAQSNHRKRLVKRIKKRSREIFDKNTEAVDEEGIYHTLGLSRAACHEHDRAIRYQLTALRYARRTHGVNSLRAADILYDAGMSYWYMNEYEKANEFWSACLQIRIMHQEGEECDNDDNDTNDTFSSNCNESISSVSSKSVSELEFANTLFNVAASYCAMGHYSDPRTTACLEDAKQFFSKYSSDYAIEAANCSFYQALSHYHRGLNVKADLNGMVLVQTETHECKQMGAQAARTFLLQTAHTYLQEAAIVYQSSWYQTSSSSFDSSDASTGGPILKAHYLYLQGKLVDALGKPRRAIGLYAHACHIYRSNGEAYNVYAASVLYVMGELYTRLPDDMLALKCLDESLQLRQKIFGPDHAAVGTTLFDIANVHARLHHYNIGIEMYEEALRIRLLTSGKDSSTVATTLVRIGALFAREGLSGKALERLEGALRIRRDRVDRAKRKNQSQADAAVKAFEECESMDDSIMREEVTRLVGLQQAITDMLGKEEMESGMVLYYMGNVHTMLKEFDTAVSCYEESLELRRKHVVKENLGAIVESTENAMLIAHTLHDLGFVYDSKGDYSKALQCYTEALAIKRCPESSSVDGASALKSSRKAERKALKQTAESSESEIVFYNGQSVSLLTIDEEESDVAQAYGLSFDHGGSLTYAATLHKIGSIHHRSKNNKVAISCFETALRIRVRRLGAEHNGVAQTLSDIGNTLRRLDNRHKDALQCYYEALRIRTKNTGSVHQEVGSLLYRMGSLHDTRKDFSQAACCYRYAVRVYGRKYIHTLGKSLCRAMLLHNVRQNNHNAHHHLLERDQDYNDCTSAGNKNSVFSLQESGPSSFSIEERSNSTHEHYMKVSSALRVASKKAEATKNEDGTNTKHEFDDTLLLDLDLDSAECWISMELFLLSLMELMHLMAGELQDAKHLTIKKTMTYFENIGADAIVTPQDTIVYQMHYLIPE